MRKRWLLPSLLVALFVEVAASIAGGYEAFRFLVPAPTSTAHSVSGMADAQAQQSELTAALLYDKSGRLRRSLQNLKPTTFGPRGQRVTVGSKNGLVTIRTEGSGTRFLRVQP